MASRSIKQDPSKLRSRKWFANPDNPNMTALYLERYMNFGLTREELQAGKPIIGIAQSGSDLSPCNRHHLQLAARIREGIREARFKILRRQLVLRFGALPKPVVARLKAAKSAQLARWVVAPSPRPPSTRSSVAEHRPRPCRQRVDDIIAPRVTH